MMAMRDGDGDGGMILDGGRGSFFCILHRMAPEKEIPLQSRFFPPIPMSFLPHPHPSQKAMDLINCVFFRQEKKEMSR
jgi:hypothetical protein